MINIITRPFESINGPNKVVNNLIKGLEKIKYPYVINKDLNYCNQIYVPNEVSVIPYLRNVKAKIILGPNLFMTPRGLLPLIKNKNIFYLQPSQWVVDWWKSQQEFNWYLKNIELKIWPTGIDTDEFRDVWCRDKNKPILIYNKERSSKELEYIESILKKKSLPYNKIFYGDYRQDEYLEILKDTSFIIWHGCHESQGIALQEALASNIPMLVLNMDKIEQWSFELKYKKLYNSPHLKYSTIPYFDERCGIISNLENLESSIEIMCNKFNSYKPRNFILENLTIEKQALRFIKLFEMIENNSDELRTNQNGEGDYLANIMTNKKVWNAYLKILSKFYL